MSATLPTPDETSQAPPSRPATPSRTSDRDGIDPEEMRRNLVRGTRIGLFVWPMFSGLDLFNVVFHVPQVSMARLLLFRLIGEGLLFWVYWLARQGKMSAEALDRAHNIVFVGLGFLISLFALEVGQLGFSYMHGISIAMVVLTALFAAPFWRSLRFTLPVALSYPLVMGLGALFNAELAAEWSDRETLARFVSHYVFVLSTAVIGALGSHAVWAARRQLYQARKLGRYRLTAPIGKGGQNEVWLAWDEQLRRNVALKILRVGEGSETDLLRFEREARAASRLGSPHTIRIFDFGASDDGIYYIAMEFLSGADLGQLIHDHGAMPDGRVIRLVKQACLSLSEAHDAGIVHRDIKPQNLFVTRVGDDYDALKLLDFGIARQGSGEGDATLTEVGQIKGTPAYMSPEVCRGLSADARSDIYSLGATMYFLLTGSLPFEGESVGKMMLAHVTVEPLTPSLRRGEPVGADIEGVVMRCLAKDPAARYQSARELFKALSSCRASEPWTSEDARAFWLLERPALRMRAAAEGEITRETTSVRSPLQTAGD